MVSATPVLSEPADLRGAVAQLQERVRSLEKQREVLAMRRRRQRLLMGGMISLLFHATLLIYLSTVSRAGPAGEGTGTGGYELAILPQEELTELESAEIGELVTDAVEAVDVASETEAALSPETPAAELSSAGAGAVESLGASGDGSGGDGSGSGGGAGGGGGGLGGGGGGTSFFGVTSKGTRVAYIVDISGSMGTDRKLEVALRELARSIDGLPDYAHFYVLLFSTNFIEPPSQKGWTRARKASVRQFVRWLEQVDANGGTEPRSAFLQVFSLEVRPDVLFFLTDGQFSDFTVEDLAALNSKGKKVIVNTIAFGEPLGQELLRQMASQTGGTFKYVPSEGGG